MKKKAGKNSGPDRFDSKEQEALDTLSDCATKVAFLVEVFNAGGPEDMTGSAAGLSLILQGILSDMDNATQYLRKQCVEREVKDTGKLKKGGGLKWDNI